MKTKRPIPLLFLFIALTRICGLLRSLVLARLWGVGDDAAAFELAQTASAFLHDTCISTLIGTAFIPAYVKQKQEKHKDAFVSKLLLPTLLFSLVLYLPLILFPQTLLSLVTRKTPSALLIKSAPALAVTSIGRVTLSLTCLFVGILQSEERAPTAAGLYCLSSFCSMGAALLFPKLLTAFTMSAILAGLDILLLVCISATVRKRHAIAFTLKDRFTVTRPMVLRAFWVILSGIFLPLLTLLASLSSASFAGSEGVSLIGYASRLVLLTAALLTSVTHAAYYAALAKTEDKPKTLRRVLLKLLLMSSAATLGLLLFAKPLVSFFFKSASFTASELDTLVLLLSLYAPSVIALTLSSLLTDYAYLANQTAQIALANLAAIILTAFIFFFTKKSVLWQIPLYFTLSAYLRLFFTALTVFSQKERHKPRVLLVLSDANIGGAGRWLLTYLKTADTSRFEILCALPENAALKDEIEALGFSVHTVGMERSFSFKNTWLFTKLMLSLRPDVVNTSASLSARIAATVTRVPVRLYTRHCVYPTKKIFRLFPVRLLMRAFSLFLTPHAVAVAPEARDNLVAMGISAKRVSVIPNGVFPIKPNKEKAQEIRRQYGIKNEPTAAICVRLEKDKSVNTLIEAIARLKKQKLPFHALIVGNGSEQKYLQNLAKTLRVEDRVHFCGFASDVSPYLTAADLYTNCSVGSEATSLAIAEAMSLSLPIVATDYGGNPHMVKDGQNGILVKCEDSRELADALSILSDQAILAKFGKASYERYLACYQANAMAKQYEALYTTLLHRKGYRIT